MIFSKKLPEFPNTPTYYWVMLTQKPTANNLPESQRNNNPFIVKIQTDYVTDKFLSVLSPDGYMSYHIDSLLFGEKIDLPTVEVM